MWRAFFTTIDYFILLNRKYLITFINRNMVQYRLTHFNGLKWVKNSPVFHSGMNMDIENNGIVLTHGFSRHTIYKSIYILKETFLVRKGERGKCQKCHKRFNDTDRTWNTGPWQYILVLHMFYLIIAYISLI